MYAMAEVDAGCRSYVTVADCFCIKFMSWPILATPLVQDDSKSMSHSNALLSLLLAIIGTLHVLGAAAEWPTGNGKKLCSSPVQLDQAT